MGEHPSIHAGSSQAAKLTGMVNIAVFAAFRCVIRYVLLSNAAFKPVCGPRQLDVWCYGWQKRHDRGKKWQRSGTVGGKDGRVWVDSGHLHAASPAVAIGCGWRVWRGMRLFKVLAARSGAALIELNYHEKKRMSRVGGCGQGSRPSTSGGSAPVRRVIPRISAANIWDVDVGC